MALTKNGVEFVKVEMWNDLTGEIFSRHYPVTMRRHDMLRNLASFALATPSVPWDGTFVRVPRRFIRINSLQGVAWDTRNVSSAAYFSN